MSPMRNRRTTSAREALANSRGALSVLDLSAGFALASVILIVLAVFTYADGSGSYQSLLKGLVITCLSSATVTGICSALGRAGMKLSPGGR